jgi:hypothetical protein
MADTPDILKKIVARKVEEVAERLAARPLHVAMHDAGKAGPTRGFVAALGSATVFATDALFLGPVHRRRLGHRGRHGNDHVADDGIAETEAARQLVERGLVTLDVHEDVVRLVHLGDRERELAAAPVLEAVDRAAGRGDDAAIAFDHGRDLFALIRVDQENDFVMTHRLSLLAG